MSWEAILKEHEALIKCSGDWVYIEPDDVLTTKLNKDLLKEAIRILGRCKINDTDMQNFRDAIVLRNKLIDLKIREEDEAQE